MRKLGALQKRVTAGVVAAGVILTGLALVGSEAASARMADANSTPPQTVIVGTSVVPVSSNGTVTIDGTPVSVPAGFTGHVALVTPPPGAPETTVDGQQQYGLPAGASGERFDLLPANSTATTVQAIAVTTPLPQPGAAGANRRRPLAKSSEDFCELEADEPYASGGEIIQGDTYDYCDTSDALVIDLNSTQYELFDSWQTRGSDDTDGGENELLEAEAKWSCAFNTTHTWHDRNNTQVTDHTVGWTYGWYLNSNNSDPTCR